VRQWLATGGLLVLIAAAGWWMVRRRGLDTRQRRRDPDWGDIPRDQLGP
jgi:UPF0716 family protein affecting phage T7 exclusion